jgi:prevent-host-death family protein
MKRIGVAELKNQLSKHLRAVEAGETVEVTDRNRPIARIEPVRSHEPLPIIQPSRPFSEIRDRVYPPANWPVDIVELLLEERRER